MKKVYFRTLSLEVTRRCQLKCAHCMRGDAQNVDMPFEIIDSVLDQTAGISMLFFTGGEPTLAVAQMDYSLEAIKKRGIPLGGIGYVTNGVELSESVKQFLLKAYSYIAECRENAKYFSMKQ